MGAPWELEVGTPWELEMCGEIGNYRMKPNYHSDTALNQHFTGQHSGSSVCETALTESYKMLN